MKKFKAIIKILVIMVTLWFILSIIDVNLHNNPMRENYLNYSKYNLFTIVENIVK